jgi:hypothetical protein
MNKKSTVVIISLSMLMSVSAMAARPSVSKNAADIETLKTQTGQLETDLSNIALTPGPQGEIGKAGAKGDAGASGATGMTGATGQDGADGIMYDGAFEGDMQYWNGNAWMMITAPTENAGSLSFCDGQPTWTMGECPGPVYEVGDQGPAGGIVFYVSNDGLTGLEAAPVDQGSAEWGCFGESVSGPFSREVGAGEDNTDLILAHKCQITKGVPMGAAYFTQIYGLGGHSDWYLPSTDELSLLLRNLQNNNFTFGYNKYWTSSQWSHRFTDALCVDEGIKCNTLISKDVAHGVRAIRGF